MADCRPLGVLEKLPPLVVPLFYPCKTQPRSGARTTPRHDGIHGTTRESVPTRTEVTTVRPVPVPKKPRVLHLRACLLEYLRPLVRVVAVVVVAVVDVQIERRTKLGHGGRRRSAAAWRRVGLARYLLALSVVAVTRLA